RKEPTMNSIIDSPKAIREEKSVTPLNISGEPIFQRHRTTGATRYSLDGGLTWQPNVERCLEERQLEEFWKSVHDGWSPLSDGGQGNDPGPVINDGPDDTADLDGKSTARAENSGDEANSQQVPPPNTDSTGLGQVDVDGEEGDTIKEQTKIVLDSLGQNEEPEIELPPFPEHIIVGAAKEFVDLYSPTTECPPEFLWSSFMTVLGVAVSTWVEWDNGLGIQPRLFDVNVGPSSTGRKSTG